MGLLQMSLSGAILIGLTALVRMAALRILPKRAFLLFWGIVLVRLLVPFSPFLRVPVPAVLPARAETTYEQPVEEAARGETHGAARPSRREAASAGGDTAGDGLRPVGTRREDAPADSDQAAVFRAVWTLGAVSTGLFFLLSYAAGYRRLRQAYPVEHEGARAWKAAHPLGRKYAVKSFGGGDSPMTCGVLRPVILAPGAESWWHSAAAKFALEHEYIHMRRFDSVLKAALALALAVHWFNPAVWVFYALANRDIELSCDEAVLLRFGQRERGAYARALLSEEERRREMPALYAGFGADSTRERIVEIMKFRKKTAGSVLLAAALALALAACSAAGGDTDKPSGTGGIAISGENLDINDVALRPEGEASRIVENGGVRLLIPLEYGDLLIVDTPQDSEEGVLFSVAEKASVDAAEAQGSDDDGAGWLFSINRISSDAYHEARCYDMSGMEVFAHDADGYYMFCHPTDVRFVRESYEGIDEDMAQWTQLNEWAATVPDTMLAENLMLTPEKCTYTALDMYLARIAWQNWTNYTISTLEHGPMRPDGVDPSPWVFRLMDGASYEVAEGETAPSGEYAVLTFPEDNTRFDFFFADGGENLIRMVWSENELLYRAHFPDDTKASEVMRQWYNALVSANNGEPLETSGFTGEEFVGEWQDTVSQRAVMSVQPTGETGVYDVAVHWGNSFDSAVQWRMRAQAEARDEILSYENGTKVEVNLSEDAEEQETVVWENGTGYLKFRDGYLTWYDEQEPRAAECRFEKAE